jgi:Domain of unknown function (DUF6484)
MSELVATPTPIHRNDSDGHDVDDLLTGRVAVRPFRTRIDGALVGRLVGFKDEGTVPLVVYEGQPSSAAVAARATVDLVGSQIGREVLLMFDDGDPYRPLVIGCLHDAHAKALPDGVGQIDVDVDGQRLVVSAKEQLVLRCGKARITLTNAGKVLIEGAYISSNSTGVNRIRGGSIHLN